MFELLLLVAALGQVAAPKEEVTYAIRRELPLDAPVTTSWDIVTKARDDAKALAVSDPKATHFVRYVWVPDHIEPASGFAQVSMVANSTFSRTSNMIQPTAVADGKLVRLDLLKYAAKEEQVGEIVNLYERLRDRDSWFNVKVQLEGPVAIVVEGEPKSGDDVSVQTQNGEWQPGKFLNRAAEGAQVEFKGKAFTLPLSQVKWKNRLLSEPAPKPTPAVEETFAAAAYLNPAGAELFALTRSSVPIMRLDEWVAFTFSSVNGGLYYPLTGIKKNLFETIREFAGNDAAQKVVRISASMRQAQQESQKTGEGLAKIAGRLDPELAKSKALIETSEITRRQRVVAFFFGTGTAPTSGVQLVAVTFDIAEDNTGTGSDPLRNVAVFETYNGGEMIFALPNGLLAYVVFNQNDEVVASVPDNIAWDHQASEVRRNAGTVRVFSGMSCANCHDAGLDNWGWQPVVNDLYDTAQSLSRILDDRGRQSGIEALQTLASQYSASTTDLQAMLNQARLPYQYRASLATNQRTTRETVAGLADSYWGYWYDTVTPQIAARDLGRSLNHENAQLFLLREINPEPVDDTGALLREDGVLMRVKDGKHVTPAQWRAIFPNVAERMLFKDKPAKVEIMP